MLQAGAPWDLHAEDEGREEPENAAGPGNKADAGAAGAAGGAGAEQDAQGDASLVLKKKRAKKARVTLSVAALRDESTGLQALCTQLRGFRASGPGKEVADVQRLLRAYQAWQSKMVPGLTLLEMLQQLDKGTEELSKTVRDVYVDELRMAEFLRVHGRARAVAAAEAAAAADPLFGTGAALDDRADSDSASSGDDEDDDEGAGGGGGSGGGGDDDDGNRARLFTKERIERNKAVALARKKAREEAALAAQPLDEDAMDELMLSAAVAAEAGALARSVSEASKAVKDESELEEDASRTSAGPWPVAAAAVVAAASPVASPQAAAPEAARVKRALIKKRRIVDSDDEESEEEEAAGAGASLAASGPAAPAPAASGDAEDGRVVSCGKGAAGIAARPTKRRVIDDDDDVDNDGSEKEGQDEAPGRSWRDDAAVTDESDRADRRSEASSSGASQEAARAPAQLRVVESELDEAARLAVPTQLLSATQWSTGEGEGEGDAGAPGAPARSSSQLTLRVSPESDSDEDEL